MGSGIDSARQMARDRSDTPGDYERHISSLIVQLEELLAERPRFQDQAPDPATLAAASFAAPYARLHVTRVPQSFPQGRAAQARALIRERRMRADYLPAALFAEPAWDMMLDLYAALYEGSKVSVSSLCIAAAVPSTTALRAIEAMTAQGCIERDRDPSDGRRIFVTLSDEARLGLDAYFDALGATST